MMAELDCGRKVRCHIGRCGKVKDRVLLPDCEVPHSGVCMVADPNEPFLLAEHFSDANDCAELFVLSADELSNGKHRNCSLLHDFHMRLNLLFLPRRVVYNGGLQVVDVSAQIIAKDLI